MRGLVFLAFPFPTCIENLGIARFRLCYFPKSRMPFFFFFLSISCFGHPLRGGESATCSDFPATRHINISNELQIKKEMNGKAHLER